MASAIVTTPSIDLTANTSFPIQLGNSIRTGTHTAKRRKVRYNHRPSFDEATNVTRKLLPGETTRKTRLELQQGPKRWRYDGLTQELDDMYVLVLSEEEGIKAVLERLDETLSFNLIRTPEEEDAEKLEQRYPHITAEEGNAEQDRDTADEQAERGNPFDWRHHIVEQQGAGSGSQASKDGVKTPVLPSIRPSKPSRPALPLKRKPSTSTATIASHKRPKPSPKPQPNASTPEPIPSLRLDRKASLRNPPSNLSLPSDQNDEDDGELILEDPNPKPAPRSSMHLALSGAFKPGDGPISLKSAMSSKEVSPNSHMGGDDDFGEEDGDVEMLKLGSPVSAENGPTEDAVDDMERELAAAFEEEESAARGFAGEREEEEEEEDVSEEE